MRGIRMLAALSLVAGAGWFVAMPAATASSVANDDRANATTIGSLPFSAEVDTTGATAEAGEPTDCAGLGASVWYRYTAPSTFQQLFVSSQGSDFDTVMAVYREHSGGISLAGCSDDAYDERAGVPITSFGGTYLIRVGGYGGVTGNLKLAMHSGGGVRIRVVDEETGGSVTGVCIGSSGGGGLTTQGDVRPSGWDSGSSWEDPSLFEVRNVPPGALKLDLAPCPYATYPPGPEYDWAPVTTPWLSVTPGVMTRVADVVATRAGRVAGTIVDKTTQQPIANAQVQLSGTTSRFATTDANGNFTIRHVPAGEYRLFGSGAGYMTGFYGGTSYETAQPVQVTPDTTTTLASPFELTRTGTISGTVTFPDGTTDKRICIRAHASVSPGPSYQFETDANGAFSYGWAEPREYRLVFGGQCYTGTSSFAPTTLDGVVVQPGQTTVANGSVSAPSASVSGVVRDASTNQPLPNVCVSVIGGGEWGSGGFTNAQGAFSAPGLAAGTYEVRYSTACFESRTHFGATYPTPVALSAGETRALDEVALAPITGGVTGAVSDPASGKPIRGCVRVLNPAPEDQHGAGGGNSPGGTFSVRLAPGNYDLLLSDCTVFESRYSPKTVNVDVGSTFVAIDGALAQADGDGDGVGRRTDNCPYATNANQADGDGDDLGNACDGDVDGDAVVNGVDNCPSVANPGQEDGDANGVGDACDGVTPPPDTDGDGHVDGADNCPTVGNSGQEDVDGDLAGDACDPDDDGDTVNDGVDNCPTVANAGQGNLDGDLAGDACDPDDDGDTVDDGVDNCPTVGNSGQEDLDGDLAGDACDPDDDGDTVNDGVDNCPAIANVTQADRDRDGIGDACDPVKGRPRKPKLRAI